MYLQDEMRSQIELVLHGSVSSPLPLDEKQTHVQDVMSQLLELKHSYFKCSVAAS